MITNKILEQDIKKFCDSIDIDYQVEFIKAYSEIGDSEIYGGKHCGSDSEQRGSEYIAQKLREIGLRNVELIPCETSRYQFNDATLAVNGDKRIIKPYGYVSPGTDTAGITGQLVDAIKCRKQDLETIDIKDKIVLMAAMGTLEGANLSGQIEMAIKYGAKAVVIYAVEDILNEDTIRVQPPNIICTVPVVGISGRDAAWLKNKMTTASCSVALTVDAEFVPRGGITYNVIGEIPGAISDERIVYTAHLDHYFKCLQDNMSSCSTLLGIAKAMIESGFKPNRTITFAFHGSHETGGMDTRYPYIFGSYMLTHKNKPEWTGKAIANINFEYTALRMKKLQTTAYVGVNALPISYFPYSPELIGDGFEEKKQYAPQTEYYMLSWSDSISYHSAGIPTMCNDPISEQYYEGTGPYVGRDHSNFDNWDVFDSRILEDIGRFYGGLGIYLDSMPYLMLDYTEQCNRIRNEVRKETLEELNISSDAYFDAVDRLETSANIANAKISAGNNTYIEALNAGISHDEKKACFDKAHKSNSKILEAYKNIADILDKYNVYDFITLGSVKYLQNVGMLNAAKEILKSGDAEKVFDSLAPIDLATSSYFFDEDVVEHMRKQICDPEYVDRRTWAAGHELNIFTYYELVETFCKESAESSCFDGTAQLLEKAITIETDYILKAMDCEQRCLSQVAELLDEAFE